MRNWELGFSWAKVPTFVDDLSLACVLGFQDPAKAAGGRVETPLREGVAEEDNLW